ncbi:6301_t:CDS:2, partial [Gigaspora margarita]
VSQNFTMKALPWNDLTFTGIFANIDASMCSGGSNNDLIFVFGGAFDYNSFTYKYDISKQQWTDVRNDFWGYCAITLPDNTILYIGGTFFGINLPLNSNTTGPTPPGRHDFSAVLTSDKRIIIFGGYGDTSSLGDLWILDITTYQWSAGTILNPNGLILNGHTANLVDNYMIVAFGAYGWNFNFSSTIYMLDVSQRDSYKWVTEFNSSTTNFKELNP